MHKRLMKPVLASMDAEKSTYFTEITEELATDERITQFENLVFLFLSIAAPYLTTQLPKRDFIGRLITFIDRNHHRILKTAYDPAFISNKDLMKPVVGEFVAEMTLIVLKKIEDGEIDENKGEKVYRIGWPFLSDDFPYKDLDDEDEEAF